MNIIFVFFSFFFALTSVIKLECNILNARNDFVFVNFSYYIHPISLYVCVYVKNRRQNATATTTTTIRNDDDDASMIK
jgi:hypothetical protein